MLFEQVINQDLSCASYLIIDGAEAAVIDPQWDIDPYLEAAQDAGATIVHVLETHFHADHVSGRRRLADATGASVHVPFDPARPQDGGIRDGDVVKVGEIEVQAIGAPGHRPEHLAYLIADHAGEPATARLLAGDSMLVGELARPDLAIDATEGAEALFATAQRLCGLGADVELWPGHVGGSLCGAGALSDETFSTIGLELSRNRLLSIDTPDEFVAEITRSIPARPPRVAKVVALNVTGVGSPGPIRELAAGDLALFIAADVCLLDVRSPEAFDDVHLAGSLNLPAAAKGVGTRAGWIAGDDESIVIVAPSRGVGERVTELLLAAGVWNIGAMSVADPDEWSRSGLAVASATALSPDDVVERLLAADVRLVDVRDRHEWRSGHVTGSVHLPLSVLRDGRGSTDLVPHDEPLAVACARGPRAAVAASVLRRRGYSDAHRVLGGIGDLAERGIALVAD